MVRREDSDSGSKAIGKIPRWRRWLRVPRALSFGAKFIADRRSYIRTTVQLTDDAKSSIVILSGELRPDFFCSRSIKEALKAAAGRGVNIAVAFGPPSDAGVVDELKELRGDLPNVELYRLRERPERHFMLFDDHDIILQHRHGEKDPEYRAVVKRKSPTAAGRLAARYEREVSKHGEEVK
jgi:phosphatidylserine/phosphatidylglycerophosphate/cardiolipin synthase-like enzyme